MNSNLSIQKSLLSLYCVSGNEFHLLRVSCDWSLGSVEGG